MACVADFFTFLISKRITMNEPEIRANTATVIDNIKETLSLYPHLLHCNPGQRGDRLKYEEDLRNLHGC